MSFRSLPDSRVPVWQLYHDAILLVSFREMAESRDIVTTEGAQFPAL